MSGPGPHNLDRVPDQDGYLIINGDGAVMASSGDLENDERVAGILMNMVRLASRIKINPDKPETFKRLSVVFDDFMYVATISSSKVYVSKRRHNPQEPVLA
ncbi:ragulator complex protein LAMTOR4-like [Patiria miniata]|uniref:Late endosomal/lysosomal adaptor and MAPK and MTOR activator 4 n=1 Tax=Patiria miniata TaxID=46514 RepID=A0A913ZGT5_PATMI|nr:ragulator complex protein LAMTOR4-like [Patiria miniata]